MATNGSGTSVSIRDERGRYLKGIAGGPGRPAGSRNRLTEDFLGDLHTAWQEHGRDAINRVVTERPEVFLAIVARTIDVRRVESCSRGTRLGGSPSTSASEPGDTFQDRAGCTKSSMTAFAFWRGAMLPACGRGKYRIATPSRN